jgi:hypothetical protein
MEPATRTPVDNAEPAAGAITAGETRASSSDIGAAASETGASAGQDQASASHTGAPARAAAPSATVISPTHGTPTGPPTGTSTADGQPGPGKRERSLRRRLGWRWAARGVLLAAVAITVMVIALAIGMRANDAAIDEHLGSATATVLSVSPLRTGIEFVDVTGATVRPEGGVLYPGLLSLGQQFVVEYSTQDPQIARVAGRTASVGTLLLVVVTVTTWVVAVPVTWWCRRRGGLPLFGSRRAAGGA